MNETALALVLGAALFHASWNYLSKKSNGGAAFVWLVAVSASVIYLPLAIIVYILSDSPFGWYELSLCLVSACIHLVYMLLLQAGYQRGDLSLVYPTARATGPLVATVAAIVILGESPSALSLVGGLIIIFGIFFLTGGAGKSDPHKVRASLLFGISTGLAIGCYTIWDSYVVSVILIPPLLLDYFTSLGRAALMAPYMLRNPSLVKAEWRKNHYNILGVAVLMPLAYLMILYALIFTPVSYIAPAREISVMFGVIMGSLLLKEGFLRRRLLWSAVVLAGMFVLVTN
jgi:drug/metabolite transporter (DMT)-like permease